MTYSGASRSSCFVVVSPSAPAMSGKCADPETRLEVDESILEYLIYMAIAALLEDARGRRTDLSSKRTMNNTALSIFNRQVELLLQMVDCK